MRKRDSLFDEEVVWTGGPKLVRVPTLYRVAAAVCGLAAAISTASAIVVATALRQAPGQLLAFAAWMTTLAFALGYGPRWFRSSLQFVVTEKHVIVRRGRLRRTMDRRAISFARIHWDPKVSGVGDLELVRAVPTGALRRRLSITLSGVVAPDRVWAIVRGVTPAAAAGVGQRPLAQRLDEGERVLWAGHPEPRWRKWFPSGWRAAGSAAIALTFGVTAVITALHGVHGLRTVIEAGLDPESVSFVALVASVSLTIVLLGGSAIALMYASLVRPARLEAQTRYLVTDRRVLIQRAGEELHLDRTQVVDVIEGPIEAGARDLFLVLDGPKARAVAAGGAFGEPQAHGLQPVLHRVRDTESIASILRAPPEPPGSEDERADTAA